LGIQRENGAYVHYRYDARGLLIDKWEPTWSSTAVDAEPKTHYDYYTSGPWTDHVKTMTMPPNFPFSYQASETYEYDNNTSNQSCAGRGLVTKITYVSPTSGIFHSFAYSQYGNKVDEWNELGERTHYTYDNYNRLKGVARGGETTSYTYNPTNGGSSPYLHTTNNPDTITSATNIVTNNVYDENFRKTSTSIAGNTTWFKYDPVGNETCVTDPRGSGPCSPSTYSTTTHYDTRNRKWYVNDAQGHQTTFTYDNASNITRIDRPGSEWEQKAYDAVNRVIRDTVSFTTGASLETWFTYSPSGKLVNVIDPRGTVNRTYPNGDSNYTTTFGYEIPSDQRTVMWYPPVAGNSDVQRWGYDSAHNLIWHTLPSGGKSFGYDQRNRKFAELWDSWSNEYRWYYFGLDDASRVQDAKTGFGNVFGANTLSRVHRDYYTTGKLKLDRQTLLDQPNGPGLPTKNVNYEYDTQYTGAETTPTRMYITNGDGTDASLNRSRTQKGREIYRRAETWRARRNTLGGRVHEGLPRCRRFPRVDARTRVADRRRGAAATRFLNAPNAEQFTTFFTTRLAPRRVCSSAMERSRPATINSTSSTLYNVVSEEIYLTQYGPMAERHWREFRPNMVRELEAKGQRRPRT
jgi:YD repeat-containing protein